jgi:hypothetical protein
MWQQAAQEWGGRTSPAQFNEEPAGPWPYLVSIPTLRSIDVDQPVSGESLQRLAAHGQIEELRLGPLADGVKSLSTLRVAPLLNRIELAVSLSRPESSELAQQMETLVQVKHWKLCFDELTIPTVERLSQQKHLESLELSCGRFRLSPRAFDLAATLPLVSFRADVEDMADRAAIDKVRAAIEQRRPSGGSLAE